MRYPCAGCGALQVGREQVFCKGCEWTITMQYQNSLSTQLRAPKTTTFPKIGFTTNPYFQKVGA